MYCVTRQHYWHDGTYAVELVRGGLDNSSPDAYCAKYVDEMRDTADPREAADTALNIWKAWKEAAPDKEIGLTWGDTLGGLATMAIEEYENDGLMVEALREWAQKEWERIPKCDRCGDPLPEKRKQWKNWDLDEVFCSEICAERRWEENERFQAEIEAEDADHDDEDRRAAAEDNARGMRDLK